jgi:hypothetical protein
MDEATLWASHARGVAEHDLFEFGPAVRAVRVLTRPNVLVFVEHTASLADTQPPVSAICGGGWGGAAAEFANWIVPVDRK